MRWNVSRISWSVEYANAAIGQTLDFDHGRGVDADKRLVAASARGLLPRGSARQGSVTTALRSRAPSPFDAIENVGTTPRTAWRGPKSLSRRPRSGIGPYPCGDHNDIS